MKARASNLVIGTSTLALLAAALIGFLGFQKIHRTQQRGPLRIVFEGSASGLNKGGSVNFDGVQVGEVLSLKLDNPRKIVAFTMVENSAPIRKDTIVGLEFQGLTGVAAISLTGGAAAAPPVPLDEDGVPTLTADLSEIQSIRDTLHNVDHVLVDNRPVMKDALLSFETYTAMLASQGDDDRQRAGQGRERARRLRQHHRQDRRLRAGSCQGQGRRTVSEGKVDPRTGREFQQAFRRLHGGWPPHAVRYQPGRQQGRPEIRARGRNRARASGTEPEAAIADFEGPHFPTANAEADMPIDVSRVTTASPMGATVSAQGTGFRTWAPHAKNVSVVAGSALAASRDPSWRPAPEDGLAPLGDGSWGGFLAGIGNGDAYMFFIEGTGSSGLEARPLRARTDGRRRRFPTAIASSAIPASIPGTTRDGSRQNSAISSSTSFTSAPGGPGPERRRCAQPVRRPFLDVVEKLEHLRNLGVNAIQLLPIQEFETPLSMGYNGVDYFSPESEYLVARGRTRLAAC